MKALSIRAPWWWFILHAGKDIENRDWRTDYRGPVLIHASKWFNLAEVGEDFADARRFANVTMPGPTSAELRAAGGHIVGRVEIVDCIDCAVRSEHSDSPWFFGRYGFVLKNPVAFATPVARKGALGLFNVPDELAVRAA